MVPLKRWPLILFLTSTSCFAQDDQPPDITDVSKVTFVNPGFSYEKRVARFQSLLGHAYMSPSIYLGYSSSLGNMSSIYFDPAVALQYRYYYNSRKRSEKGKRTEMNSLNYIAAAEDLSFSRNAISSSYYVETNRRPMNRFGLVWGLQRNRPKRFSVDFNIGAGYLMARSTSQNTSGEYITSNEGVFTFLGQLTIGLWLNKKK
jgi:hypothetical protein